MRIEEVKTRENKEEKSDDLAGDEHNEPASYENTTEMHKPMPSSRSTCGIIQNIYEKSLWAASKRYQSNMLGGPSKIHEIREFEDNIYRDNKNLPPDAKLDSGDIICAILSHGRWHCKVPQCGPTFEPMFAIDIHLQAHGTIALTNWYCGDATCDTGAESIFHDRTSFGSHVATGHIGSSYSTAAGRRVPKGDVLITSLMEQLKFERLHIKTSNRRDKRMKASTTLAGNKIQHGPPSDTDPKVRARAKLCGDELLEGPEIG
ncbi:uncharacterized protein Z518_10094 [Rhinocladiella mackenziei CBS 650.93]|uniref:C2H2-type domain-containing protein n=1 Tax=Rhinocladiella mackenziei CBS 650.93 TaxID=1442369 RepID=A0A0D2GRY2_9EURO|nr:uncharacterized protein Z518_10094 [Rhinocladiella mackenziei CBS 650.93]KIX01028.1 hypothetical protein Z518_10094 [Rhinocladiella mackenziei CBS 650.93]